MRRSALICFSRWSAVALVALSTVGAATLPQAQARAQAAYDSARTNYLALPGETVAASGLAKACFDLAEFLTQDRNRVALAEEGIKAARAAIALSDQNAAGHHYLALNLGQLARTKFLGALPLLRQMERAFLRAAELDPHIAYAGPDRSVGMLYMEAPGWPASIGSKRKARKHLERALSIEPDYPDNHLTAMEAYQRWKDSDALGAAMARYRELIPRARAKYSGDRFDQAWEDWTERWEAILKREAD